MRYFIAVYDKDDMPYITFEDYKECARFFKTSSATIRCNISRKQERIFRGEKYKLFKYELNDLDISIPKGSKNLYIGALLEVLDI